MQRFKQKLTSALPIPQIIDLFTKTDELLKQNIAMHKQQIDSINALNRAISKITHQQSESINVLNKTINNIIQKEKQEQKQKEKQKSKSTDDNHIILSFPKDEETFEFPIGVTIINFLSGKVLFPNNTSQFLSRNLEISEFNEIKSFRIETDKRIKIRANNDGGWFTIKAGDYLQNNFISCVSIEIRTFEPTNISIFASTHPASIIDKAEIISFKSLYTHQRSIDAGLDVIHDTIDGKPNIEIWVKSSAPADFNVFGSRDSINWRKIDTIILAVAGETHRKYTNAFQFIRVQTAALNDNEIEIVSGR